MRQRFVDYGFASSATGARATTARATADFVRALLACRSGQKRVWAASPSLLDFCASKSIEGPDARNPARARGACPLRLPTPLSPPTGCRISIADIPLGCVGCFPSCLGFDVLPES